MIQIQMLWFVDFRMIAVWFQRPALLFQLPWKVVWQTAVMNHTLVSFTSMENKLNYCVNWFTQIFKKCHQSHEFKLISSNMFSSYIRPKGWGFTFVYIALQNMKTFLNQAKKTLRYYFRGYFFISKVRKYLSTGKTEAS